MFCRKCGRKIENNAKFCGYCGTLVEPVKNDVTQNLEQQDNKRLQSNMDATGNMTLAGMQQAKRIIKINYKVVALIAMAVFVLIVSWVVVYFTQNTVKLDDYITVSFEGYNTLGKVSVDIDYQKFSQKYMKKIRNKKTGNEWEKELMRMESDSKLLLYFFDTYIDYEFSNKNELCNGDEITMTWDCQDEQVFKDYGLRLVHKDRKFKVDNLAEADIVDPFEDMVISYNGISPFGRIDIKYSGSDKRLENFSLS